ncbi:hypothetical protein BGZ65_006638, partial [Modicella reniformis]
MDLLRPHFLTLTDLDLAYNNNATSAMAQEIMSSCPLLVTFRAPQIEAMDIVEGHPWVCFGIQQLRTLIHFNSITIRQVQPIVFDQLSRLTRLEVLNLSYLDPMGVRFGDDLLDLRLESGLDKLSSLRLLRVIEFPSTKQSMDEQEIDWILEHWKFLRRIDGVLNAFDPDINKALRQRLEQH